MSKADDCSKDFNDELVKETTPSEDADIKTAVARLVLEARQMARTSEPQTRDITAEFNAASSKLAPGELVKDDFFTLFEAVGALEIMDSKMDSGCIPPDDIDEGDFDFSQSLSAAQVVWIMDEMMCQEISWLSGYPLSQTVYTSIHIDRITDPSDRYHRTFVGPGSDIEAKTNTTACLHAFCCSLLKCCSMALDLIRSQNYCEEEDFVTHQFGRDLIPAVSSDDILVQIDASLEALLQDNLPALECKALQARLLFRRYYMQSIFGQTSGWQDVVDLLQGPLQDTHSLGEALSPAFTDKVQRHLATSTPPRPKLELSWSDACQAWVKLCNDVAAATQVTSPWIRQSPPGLQKAMASFAWQQPSTLPRAILQDIFFVDGKIADDVSHFDLVTCDLRDLVLPGDVLLDPTSFAVELPSDPRHRACRVLETFLDGVLDEYMNIYRLLCANRCRVRRALTQLVPIFETLEDHAVDYDIELESINPTKRLDTAIGKQQLLSPLRNWVNYYKVKIMSEAVLMGFETDIYLPDEIGKMYWYLSSLIRHRQSILAHIRIFTEARCAKLKETEKTDLYAECLASLEWYTALDTELTAMLHLAHALWRTHSLILHLNLAKAPSRAFASSELMYEARMKPYLSIKDPSPPSADALASACELSESVEDTLSAVNAATKSARTALAALKAMTAQVVRCVGSEAHWRKEIKQLETTCVALSVLVTQIKGALNAVNPADAATPPQLQDTHIVSMPVPGKRYHPWWIVPQLKAKA